jgi:ribosome assembly protein RRB1
MSKRTATEVQTSFQNEGQAFPKASGSKPRREAAGDGEMGEFEDAWEDEIESDEEVVDAEAAEDEDGASLYAIYLYDLNVSVCPRRDGRG